MKKIFVLTALIALCIAAQTFAANMNFKTPPEILAQLLGKDVPALLKEAEESHKSLAAIANEAGVFEKFKAEVLAVRKSHLDDRVTYGSMTRQEADDALKKASEHLEEAKSNDFYREGRGHGGKGERGKHGWKNDCGAREGRGHYGH